MWTVAYVAPRESDSAKGRDLQMADVDDRGGHSNFVGVPHARGAISRRYNLTRYCHGHGHGIDFELAEFS